MYENNLKDKIKNSRRKRLSKKKDKRLIYIISYSLLIVILIFFLKYFGIFPFTSNLLSYNRINILLVGCDEDENNGRADTIVFFSIAPKTKDALILSIPRDLRVEIPGRGMDKINHAYAFGGKDLLIKTVNLLLDLPIHFYAVVDFEEFVDIINELGGVEINIEKEMHYVDKAGGVNINLYPGKQILNGEKALQYIRFRHDKLGDLGRIKRQQKLGLAIFKKMIKFNSVAKISQISEELKGYVESNIKVQDVITLANLFRGVNEKNYKIETVQGNPVYIKGINYLEPNVAEIQKRVKSLIYGSNRGIRVEVLNGNAMSGVAHSVAKELELQGFQVVKIDNADNFDYKKTEIIIYSNRIVLNNEFKKLFKDFEIIKRYGSQSQSDLTIILGNDMVN
jgi:LCP family protein required for cell wall assembly